MDNDVLVYSTRQGRICPECGQPAASCKGHAQRPRPQTDGTIRISLDTKGRKGKGVTVITGIPLDEGALEALARQLKQKCGAGGTIKDWNIEIQGDKRDIVLLELQKAGYRVKRVG